MAELGAQAGRGEGDKERGANTVAFLFSGWLCRDWIQEGFLTVILKIKENIHSYINEILKMLIERNQYT